MTDILIKRRNVDTDMHRGRTPYEDEGRHWGEASISQILPTKHQKLEEAWNRFLPIVLRRNQSGSTLISEFQTPEL